MMDRRFWVASLVWLLAQQWMTVVKGDECDYVFFEFPLATDSCVVMINSTGSFSSKAECNDDDGLTLSYWSNGDCSGDESSTNTFSQDGDANFTWVCDAEDSGDDCSRTLYRIYSEEGCSDTSDFYTEFYIVNDVCVSWTLSSDGQSAMYTCEKKGDKDVMLAHVYESDDCSGTEAVVANFTSGCTENNRKITITCDSSGDDDDDDDDSSAMTAFGSIFTILAVSLAIAFM